MREYVKQSLLQSRDPGAAFIAYEDLVTWMEKHHGEVLDRDARAEAIAVINGAAPYYLEYSLLFKRAYEHAHDSGIGPGLRGTAALAHALKTYRSPEAWEKLGAEEVASLRARTAVADEPAEWSRRAQSESAFRKAFAQRELERLKGQSTNGMVKGVTTERHLAEIPEAQRKDALAAHFYLRNYFQLDTTLKLDLFDASEAANKILFRENGRAPRENLENYVSTMTFARDAVGGLGLGFKDAQDFTASFLELPDPAKALDRFHETLLRDMATAPDDVSPDAIWERARAAAGVKSLLPVAPAWRLGDAAQKRSQAYQRHLAEVGRREAEQKEMARVAELKRKLDTDRAKEARRNEEARVFRNKAWAAAAVLAGAAAGIYVLHRWATPCRKVPERIAEPPRPASTHFNFENLDMNWDIPAPPPPVSPAPAKPREPSDFERDLERFFNPPSP